MAVTIDGEVYRNLQEQVEKNKCDISALKFGLIVVAHVATVADLDTITVRTGEAVAVGEMIPYDYYVMLADGSWANLGNLASTVEGPQGEQGLQGDPGLRGSRIFFGTVRPDDSMDPKDGDLYLNTITGDLWGFKDGTWGTMPISILKGPRGPQGLIGLKGDKGEKGDKGDTGLTGTTLDIRGVVANYEALPDVYSVPLNTAYILNDTKHIYGAVKPLGSLNRSWVDFGEIVIPPFGDTKGTIYEGDKGKALELDKINVKSLQWTSLPEGVSDKKTFYNKTIGTLRTANNKIYLYGTPEETPIKEFFEIWGKPADFKATHVYIVIESVSNESKRDSFKMTIHSSNYSNMYYYVVSGYNSQMVGNGSNWISYNKLSIENQDKLAKNDGDYIKLTSGNTHGVLDPKGGVLNDMNVIERTTYDGGALQEDSPLTETYINEIKGQTVVKNQMLSTDKIKFKFINSFNEDSWQLLPRITPTFTGHSILCYLSNYKNVLGIRMRYPTLSENTQIATNVDSGDIAFQVLVKANSTIEADINYIDLTVWFGAGNEPKTVEEAFGRGVPATPFKEAVNNVLVSSNISTFTSSKADGSEADILTIDSGELRGVKTEQDIDGPYSEVYDTLTKDKKITRLGIFDLGKIDIWHKSGSDYWNSDKILNSYLTEKTPMISNVRLANIKCALYTTTSANRNGWSGTHINNAIFLNETGYIYIVDSTITTSKQLKDKLQGVMLVYELATPTTETIPTKDLDFVAFNGGKESMQLNTVAVPILNNHYVRNLVGKLSNVRTYAEQKAIDDRQDERITALENKPLNGEYVVEKTKTNKYTMQLVPSQIDTFKGIRVWYEFEYQGNILCKYEDIRFVANTRAKVYVANTIPDPAIFSNTLVLQYNKENGLLEIKTTGSAVPSIIDILEVKGIN